MGEIEGWDRQAGPLAITYGNAVVLAEKVRPFDIRAGNLGVE